MQRPLFPCALAVAALAALVLGPSMASAAYPGGNGEILFERSNKLWTIGPAGPQNTEVKLVKPGVPIENPEYSPNGRKIAFAADLGAGQSWQIVVIKANGKDPKNVTRNADECLSARSPSWSPDGTKIAFICNDRGFPYSSEVYTVKTDGRSVKRITSTDEVEYVKWNPGDATEIAFVNDQLLYTVPAAGGNATVLNDDPPGITGAGWFDFDYKPDGTQIVIEDGEGNIHMMDSTTGGFGASLIGGSDAQVEPTFSPSGTLIAYANAGSNVFDIHTSPVTGSPAGGFALTSTATAAERDPTWRPMP